MKDPERLDLPSGSSFEIVVACPGQPNLKAQLPESAVVVEAPDELRDRGDRIHKARELLNSDDLDAEEVEIYKAGIEYENKMVNLWCQDNQLESFTEQKREDRLWLHDPSTVQPVLSAKLDVHYRSKEGSDLLIIDWKSGWSWNLTPSQRNWQLRVQAVLAWREYNGVKKIRVGFVKPIATSERIDYTDYTENDLKRSEEMILQFLWLSKQPEAPRIAGRHCNYCPCKPDCREAGAHTLLPTVMGEKVVPIAEADIEVMVERMSLPDLALIHTRARTIYKILESVKERLKTLNDEELKDVGLGRFPGRKLDPIVKTKEAFDFLKTFGISEEEIWSALKFSKTELVDALRRDQGWAKAQADGFVRGRLEPFIDKKTADDSIGAL